MRPLTVIYDDTIEAPEEIRQSIGVDRFGAIVFRRRTLTEAMQAVVAEAEIAPPLVLREPDDWAALLGRLQSEEISGLVLICPAPICATRSAPELVTFLRQL